jgi:4-amino-4-deoxy-L-arabinose transferase-like glycosyltransferase
MSIRIVSTGPSRLPPGLAIALLMVAGLALRLWRLGDASLWLDEAASVQFAGLPWSVLWLSGYDNAPPLYYSLLKLVLPLSRGEFAIRLPSVLFGVLTIPLVYLAGRLIAGRWAGLAAALYLVLAAAHIEYSQEARGYSLLVFALAVALVGLLLLFRQTLLVGAAEVSMYGRRREGIGLAIYATGILAALYTSNIAVFFIFLAQMAFLFHWVTRGGRDRALAMRWLLVNGVVFILWLPWLYIIVTQLLGDGSMAWLAQPNARQAARIWGSVNAFGYVWRGQPWLDLALCLLCLLGAFRLRKCPLIPLILLGVALLGPFLIWLVGFAHPLFLERTIIWSLLGTALLVGSGIDAMRGPAAVAALVLVAALSIRSVQTFLVMGAAENSDWRTAYAAWQRQLTPQTNAEAAIFCGPSVALPMLYYARQQTSLPPLLGWGIAADGTAATALILDRSTADAGPGDTDWLARIPHDLFLWKRGAADARRKPLPVLPEAGRWRQAVWRRLAVTFAHCPAYSRDSLRAALHQTGWRSHEVTSFNGGELVSYACSRGDCVLPGVSGPAPLPRDPLAP